MLPCRYAKSINCKKCEVVYYNSCKKFITAHAAYLSRHIRPFKYTSNFPLKDNVVWSKSVNLAKSAALRYAVKLNSEVVSLSLSQVLNLVINHEEYSYDVVYIDISSKVLADQDKIKSCLTSFVESVIMNGGCVAIFVSINAALTLEYSKI